MKRVIALLLALLLAGSTVTACVSAPATSEARARQVAEDFISHSPTFRFDGMAETLEMTGAEWDGDQQCWEFTFEFDSRHAGYGDRTGMMMAQVITHHRAAITVKQTRVTRAVLDGRWDMLRQRELE